MLSKKPSKSPTVPATTNKEDGTTNKNDEITTTSKKRSDEKKVCIFYIIWLWIYSNNRCVAQ